MLLSSDIMIIGMAKPTIPFTTPATKATARAIPSVVRSNMGKIGSILRAYTGAGASARPLRTKINA
jgi:hypothetical protein